MSLARVFCSWSIAAVLLLLSIAFSNSAESEKLLDPVVVADDETGEAGNGTSNVTLTGNPQIDYIHDPNLPRELNGYNLSDYPFYHRVPKNINFSCDGRKDGFYASVEHKCQIYHHCLFGTRFDFICANYTAFDQRTFICQFVSEVDCPNSHMYFHRNKELYVTKSTTTAAPLYIDRDIYRRRPSKKHKSRPRLASEVEGDGDTGTDKQTDVSSTTSSPATGEDGAPAAPPPKRNKDADYADDDYYEDDVEYSRRPTRPRRRFRKCRNGRRRGRRCRPRRPTYYYDDDDYAYDDEYDYAYYDDVRPRKGGKRRRPLNAIPAGTSQVTSTSSSETPPPTSTTTTTTTELPPLTSSELSVASASDPLDSDSIAVLQKQRDELFKPRRPTLRPPFRPSRQNDKNRTPTTSTTTSTTTTERAKPSTTSTTTTTTTEIPQYIYDYEYYEDDTPVDQAPISTTTTTTTVKPFLRGKLRGGNSAAALLDKQQRVQQSIQVRVTEDSGTNTNTIRRRDNSNVQTPTRVATPPPTTSTTTTTTLAPPVSRPARFWQRKSTVKSISTTTAPSTTTTTTTLAPYYQEYQDYDDVEADPQPTAPPKPIPAPRPQQPPPRQSNRFQAIVNPPQHQYGTSPAAALTYASNAPSASPQLQPQQSVTSSSRGHGSSYSSSSYAPPPRPNKHYAMQQPQQYSQSSSSSSSISSSNNNNNRDSTSNYNTNSYHRQRSPSPPSPVVPKPEFISLVDEDYNNPYVSGPSGSTSPSSTRFHAGGGGGGGGGGVGAAALGAPGYHHQHPIRFFEQHQPPAFLFGAASEYNNPQFAFPPRSYPSPSNFQPYGHSTRRFAPHIYK